MRNLLMVLTILSVTGALAAQNVFKPSCTKDFIDFCNEVQTLRARRTNEKINKIVHYERHWIDGTNRKSRFSYYLEDANEFERKMKIWQEAHKAGKSTDGIMESKKPEQSVLEANAVPMEMEKALFMKICQPAYKIHYSRLVTRINRDLNRDSYELLKQIKLLSKPIEIFGGGSKVLRKLKFQYAAACYQHYKGDEVMRAKFRELSDALRATAKELCEKYKSDTEYLINELSLQKRATNNIETETKIQYQYSLKRREKAIQSNNTMDYIAAIISFRLAKEKALSALPNDEKYTIHLERVEKKLSQRNKNELKECFCY